MKLRITQNFKISKRDLVTKNPKIKVRIHLKYPALEGLLQFKPKERRRRIKLELQEKYQLLKTSLPKTKFERIGLKKRPSGMVLSLKYKELLKVSKLAYLSNISIVNVKGSKKKKSKLCAQFFSVKVRIAIQIEGVRKGDQEYADRIITVKATSFENAEKKVVKELKEDEPYLNPYGVLVRWKFEKVLDSYETYIDDKDEFDLEHGVEVFSEFNRRKLKPKHVWERQWKK
jgi:hypothetical protein